VAKNQKGLCEVCGEKQTGLCEVCEEEPDRPVSDLWRRTGQACVRFMAKNRTGLCQICGKKTDRPVSDLWRRTRQACVRFVEKNQTGLCEICFKSPGNKTGFCENTSIFPLLLPFQLFSSPIHPSPTRWTMAQLEDAVPQGKSQPSIMRRLGWTVTVAFTAPCVCPELITEPTLNYNCMEHRTYREFKNQEFPCIS